MVKGETFDDGRFIFWEENYENNKQYSKYAIRKKFHTDRYADRNQRRKWIPEYDQFV